MHMALQRFINETLRVHATAANGLPRISPGATVDGIYVPKGVGCPSPPAAFGHFSVWLLTCAA
jgi:cytochrome P450